MADQSDMEALLEKDWVGPVLLAGEFADAVIEALRADNLNTELQLFSRVSYVRVLGEGPLKLRRDSLEDMLGRSMRFPGEVEVNLSSFAGRIKVGSDEIEWYYET